MELILTRIAKRKTYTIGRLAIRKEVNDEYLAGTADEYFCDTLEPTWRDYAHGGRKIKGRSAIPEGRYAVVISWSPKMKAWLPILLGVPNFEGIRIHAGNTAEDTAGCILVGKNPAIEREKLELASASEREKGRSKVNKLVGQVVDSRIWLHRLKQKIVEAKERGEAVWITIK